MAQLERRGRLGDAVKDSIKPSQVISWDREDGAPQNLIDATLTGTIRNKVTVRDIVGAFTVTDTDLGQFRWDYAAEDVAENGTFYVQFMASFEGEPSVRSYEALWVVR